MKKSLLKASSPSLKEGRRFLYGPATLSLCTQTILRICTISFVLVIWELIIRIHPDTIFPAPSSCLRELWIMFRDGSIFPDCIISIRRVLVGYSIAVVTGILLGILFGLFPFIRAILLPILEIFRPIPPIAWIPISIVLFSLGDPSSYFVIFIGAVFPVVTNTLLGIQEVSPVYIEAARSLGASKWRRFIHVIWPSALPSIFAGLRVGLGFAWMCVVAAEMFAARSGLGYMIQFNRQMLRLDRVVAGMLMIGLIGFIMNRLMIWIENRCLPWRNTKMSLYENGSDHSPSFLKDEFSSTSCKLIDSYIGNCQVEVSNLSFNYNSNLNIIQNLNLTIPRGQFLCILGPSGCGKTTFLRLLAGLEEPKEGEILIESNPLKDRTKEATMVFQGFSLFPWKTAYANLVFAIHGQNLSHREIKENAIAFLDMVGLTNKHRCYPHQMSGGQQQRVGMIRSLANRPRLLLLDEPFAALDSFTRESLQNDVSHLLTKWGITTVMVTHDIYEAIYMADRIIVMSNDAGNIVRDILIPGKRPRTEEFRHDPHVVKLHEELWNVLHDNSCFPAINKEQN